MSERADAVVGRALVACVTGRPDDAIDRVVAGGLLPDLIAAARYHRVLNLVHLALEGRTDLDVTLAAGLKRYYLHQIGHHLRAVEDLAGLDEAFAARGIPWLIVKGPVLSEVVYERPDLREYHDLDVVIPRETYPQAIEALRSAGAELLDRNWELIRREGRAQLHVSLRLGTVADVHHHLLNRAAVRHSFAMPIEEMLERARLVSVGGLTVRTLDPVDTLLHLCIHAGLAGGHRLIWLKDVERSVAREAPSWTELIARARSYRAGPLVAVTLSRARDALGCDVPADVIGSLFASRLRRWLTAVTGRIWPVERAGTRPTPAVIWAQAVRDTWSGTVAAATSRVMRPILRKSGPLDEEEWTHPSEADAASAATSHEGPEDYLKRIAGSDRTGD